MNCKSYALRTQLERLVKATVEVSTLKLNKGPLKTKERYHVVFACYTYTDTHEKSYLHRMTYFYFM